MSSLRIAVAGLGTVGSSVVSLIQKQAKLIEARACRPVVITAVSSRSRAKHNQLDLTGIDWVDNPLDLVTRDDVDVICELIGGADGTAKELCEASLKQGKSVVTANKAMLATHGAELAKLAEANDASILYEAAVAGGIPIVKTLRESLAGNQISSITGILNGTSNYILDRMVKDGISFETALQDAQELGYAEADPSADVDGFDAAHKLTLLSALAYGIVPDMSVLSIEGIRCITQLDIKLADKLGYVIKHVGRSFVSDAGTEQRVSPCLIPKNEKLAAVDGVLNAVRLHGDFVGDLMLTGAGAGGGATASAVASDLVDLARGIKIPVFGQAIASLKAVKPLKEEKSISKRYIRVQNADNSGLLDQIQAVLPTVEHVAECDGAVAVITPGMCGEMIAPAISKIYQIEGVNEMPLCLRIENQSGEKNA